MKPSPVDITFDPLFNGMHGSCFTKMSLRTLILLLPGQMTEMSEQLFPKRWPLSNPYRLVFIVSDNIRHKRDRTATEDG